MSRVRSLGGDCERLTRVSAAFRLLALASLQPREAGERRSEIGAVAGVSGEFDRFVVAGRGCRPAVGGRVMTRSQLEEMREHADRRLPFAPP